MVELASPENNDAPEVAKMNIDRETVKMPLPKDLQGKVRDGTYYFLGNIEGYDSDLLLIAVIKDNNLISTVVLNAKTLYTYLSLNKAKFEGKVPQGVV